MILPSIESTQVTGAVKKCQVRDVIFGKLRPYLAKTATIRREVCVVGEFLVLRPTKEVRPEFLEYILRSFPVVHEISALTAGAKMPRVEWTTLGTQVVAVPSTDEQKLIVRYLGAAELRIWRAIVAKEKVIALLDERRRVVSQRLVTRGLVEPEATRPSGISWLGDVPAHWQIRPAKFFYREANDRSVRGEEQLMSVSHLTGVTPRSSKNVTMFMAASYVGHKVCQPDDLVINTMWAWMGALGVASSTGIISPAYAVYRPLTGSPLLPDYANLLLRTRPYVDEYTCRSTGIRASRLRLYPDRFLSIPVVCPPKEEQSAIVQRVNTDTESISASIASELQEIELLQEFRSRLIADVMSGERDVTGPAQTLPEFVRAELDEILLSVDGDNDDEDDEVIADAV